MLIASIKPKLVWYWLKSLYSSTRCEILYFRQSSSKSRILRPRVRYQLPICMSTKWHGSSTYWIKRETRCHVTNWDDKYSHVSPYIESSTNGAAMDILLRVRAMLGWSTWALARLFARIKADYAWPTRPPG